MPLVTTKEMLGNCYFGESVVTFNSNVKNCAAAVQKPWRFAILKSSVGKGRGFAYVEFTASDCFAGGGLCDADKGGGLLC